MFGLLLVAAGMLVALIGGLFGLLFILMGSFGFSFHGTQFMLLATAGFVVGTTPGLALFFVGLWVARRR